jgi:hypothetical protein
MTHDDVLFGYRLRLFTLAEELGSVSEACRQMGVARSTYTSGREARDPWQRRHGRAGRGAGWSGTTSGRQVVAAPVGLRSGDSSGVTVASRGGDGTPQLKGPVRISALYGPLPRRHPRRQAGENRFGYTFGRRLKQTSAQASRTTQTTAASPDPTAPAAAGSSSTRTAPAPPPPRPPQPLRRLIPRRAIRAVIPRRRR